jgi:hypothetical protein
MNPVLLSERCNSRITFRGVSELIGIQDDRAMQKRAALRHSFVNASNSKLNEKQRVPSTQNVTVQKQR